MKRKSSKKWSAVAIVFFAKSRHLPMFMIILLLANVLMAFIDDRALRDFFGAGNVLPIIGAAIVAAIWIPYFCYSKRVKATFRK